VALQSQELWRQLRDAEAVLPGPRRGRRRRLWLIPRSASAPASLNWRASRIAQRPGEQGGLGD